MGRHKLPFDQLSPECVKHNKAYFQGRCESPKPKGKLGPASKWFSPEEKAIWKKLVKNAPAALGESDRTLLEIVVVLKVKLEGHKITPSEMSQLISGLSKLGMIPADRRPIAEPKKEPDELDEFINANEETGLPSNS